jgi:hypothetical protein
LSQGITIPHEVADAITLANLTDHYQYLREENRAHLEDGKYLHAEDLGRNIQIIHALEVLIPYYGGQV